MVVGGTLGNALALKLRREADHAGGAAKRCRGGGTFKRVGIGAAVLARLFDMAMAVDPTRQQQLAGGIDLARAMPQFGAECRDLPIGNANIAQRAVGRGGDGGVADDEVE